MNGLEVRDNSKAILRTTQGHMLIDLDINPPHFKVITISPIALTSLAGEAVTQTILSIPHRLPFTPFVDCYFFPASDLSSNPDTFFQTSGSYYHNFFSFINLGGLAVDGLTIKTNDTTLDVIYTYDPAGAGTSVPFPVKMKYMIFSNPGYNQP